MNISDLLDPEKMKALDASVEQSRGYKKEVKSFFVKKWHLLLEKKCPSCGFFLNENEHGFDCSNDSFKISKARAAEIINGINAQKEY